MLLAKLKDNSELTPTEKTIAKYILEHTEKVGEMSAAELGEVTYTSKSAVLRLCTKLGVDGYRTFVHDLTVEYMEQNRLEHLLSHEPFSKDSTPGEIMNDLPNFYTVLIENAKLRLDKNVIHRVVNRLRHMDNIDIYGAGITCAVAQIGAYKFRSIGVESQAVESANERYLFRTQGKGRKAAIVMSLTGTNELMIRSAQVLQKAGYYVVGIGGDTLENNPEVTRKKEGRSLVHFCNDYIRIYRHEMLMGTEMITMVNVYNYILDILFVSLLTDNYDKNLEAALKVFHLYRDGDL